MAKQMGAHPFVGRMGDAVGFERDGQYFLKRVGGMPYARWLTSRRLARGRENAVVFGGASKLASHVWRGLPKAVRNVCGGYTHNRLLSELVKAARLCGARVPDAIPAEVAARTLLRLELGPDAAAAGQVYARLIHRAGLSKAGGGDGGADARLAKAERFWQEAMAKGSVNAWHDAVRGEVVVSGLGDAAERLARFVPASKLGRKPGRLEFQVQVLRVDVAGAALDDPGTTRLRKYSKVSGAWRDSVSLPSTNAYAPFLVEGWQQYDAALHADGLNLKLGQVAMGEDEVKLLVVAVEWRVVKGYRFRKLDGAAVVRVAGLLLPSVADTVAALGRSRVVRRRRRTGAERVARGMMMEAWRGSRAVAGKSRKGGALVVERVGIVMRE